MSNEKQLLEQALGALETAYSQTCSVGRAKDWQQLREAIAAIRARLDHMEDNLAMVAAPVTELFGNSEQLVQPAQQEPVTQTFGEENVELGFYSNATGTGQQRELVGEVEMGQLVGDGPHKSAGNPDAEGAVAVIEDVDEYGPMLGWYKHWINFPVGTLLYTTPPAAPVQESCDMGDICAGCSPRNADGSCPHEKPNLACDCYVKGFNDGMKEMDGVGPYTTPPAQEFVCSTGLCHYKATSDARLMEMPQQEPVGTLNIWFYKGHGNYDFDYWGSLGEGTYAVYTTPPAAQPAPVPIKPIVDPDLDVNQRLAFKLGWKSAEEAHGITEKGQP